MRYKPTYSSRLAASKMELEWLKKKVAYVD